jgi:hypothetical protein
MRVNLFANFFLQCKSDNIAAAGLLIKRDETAMLE